MADIKIEFSTSLGSLLGFGSHLALNMKYISLYQFCVLSLSTALLFALTGYLSGNRSLLVSQIGWGGVAILGIVKNFNF